MGKEPKWRSADAETRAEGKVPAPDPEIEPAEIRALRKRIGLSQAEAGELLGGGPRAFTKYEAGSVKPAAAVVTLLRLLEHDPNAVHSLRAIKSPPITPTPEAVSPFQVTGEHIERFDPLSLPQLLRRLLHAEARAHGLPADGIHVAENVSARDGGEDGRIVWQGGKERTPFLPSRDTRFQLKSGQVAPAQAAGEVVRNGEMKPMVRRVIEAGGHYRVLCAHSYTGQSIDRREQSMREAIRAAGLKLEDHQITFWDASQIAAWTNQHPAVAVWAMEQTQPRTVAPFHSWAHWAGHPDHKGSPAVEDERLPALRNRLLDVVVEPQRVLRVVGLSGIGKSRLVLEALGSAEDCSASDLVLYAHEAEANTESIRSVVETLADSGARAIVVVNRCSPQTHRVLAGAVSRSSSRLSLVTLDDEVPSTTLDEMTEIIDPAPRAVIEAIIGRILPNSPAVDRDRLVHFSEGFPQVAINVAGAWASRPIPHCTDDDVLDAFILGRDCQEPDATRKSAMLVAAFGVVDVESGEGQSGHLEEVASFRHDLDLEDLHIGIGRLVERGVVQRKGRLRSLQPRPIAMRLAERQWKEWRREQWDRVLTGDINPALKETAAERLAQLNTTPVAEEVARHVCRRDSPLRDWQALARPGQARVLPALAEAHPSSVLVAIENALNDMDDLLKVVDEMRRFFVRALEGIVLHGDTFHTAARLLLRLAAAETESFANSATGVFVGLFRVYLGNTAADGDTRLTVFDHLWDNGDDAMRAVLVEALNMALQPVAMRLAGAEAQGAAPAVALWLPDSQAARNYVTDCLSRLAHIAATGGAGQAPLSARHHLASALRDLLRGGYIDAVEEALGQVAPVVSDMWLRAVETLGQFLAHDAASVDAETTARVQKLFNGLQPRTLDSRVHMIVTAMPWDYPCGEKLDTEERRQRQEGAIRQLAHDLAKEPDVLATYLPTLSKGEQRKAVVFGEKLGELDDVLAPADWLPRIDRAALDAPESERNLDLLRGYYYGVAKKQLGLATKLKRNLARFRELTPALPSVCAWLGIAPSDIALVVDALSNRSLLPVDLAEWGWGGVLTKLRPMQVAPLFDALLAHPGSGAFPVALHLMSDYGDVQSHLLDHLREQVRTCVAKWIDDGPMTGTMDAHRFERLALWLLGKGKEDADARAAALDLSKAIVASWRQIVDQPAGILHRLLSDFPEVVWPYLGAAIISDPCVAWSMSNTLSGSRSLSGQAPIFCLPEETLLSWCYAHPDKAPAFAARVVPVLAAEGESPHRLHPLLQRLIDKFGKQESVLEGIEINISNYSWVGSMTNYYARYIDPIHELTRHETPEVRLWAKRFAKGLRARIDHALNEDAEVEARV